MIGEQKLTTEDELGRNVVLVMSAGACCWNRSMWGQNVHGAILTCLPSHVAWDSTVSLHDVLVVACSQEQVTGHVANVKPFETTVSLQGLIDRQGSQYWTSLSNWKINSAAGEYSPAPCLSLNPVRQYKTAPLRWPGVGSKQQPHDSSTPGSESKKCHGKPVMFHVSFPLAAWMQLTCIWNGCWWAFGNPTQPLYERISWRPHEP